MSTPMATRRLPPLVGVPALAAVVVAGLAGAAAGAVLAEDGAGADVGPQATPSNSPLEISALACRNWRRESVAATPRDEFEAVILSLPATLPTLAQQCIEPGGAIS